MTIHVICVILTCCFINKKCGKLSPGGHFLVKLRSLGSDQAEKSQLMEGWVSEIRITS